MRGARVGRSYDVPEGDPDTALRSIWVAANRPGAERLVKAAQRYGLGVSVEVARAFINRQSIAQIFAPERKSEGAVAARSMDALWQVDLIDLTQLPKEENDGYQYILVATNVFDRMVGAKPLKGKSPTQVREAFEELLVNEDAWPEVVDTDGGEEFKGDFDELLKEKGILHTYKDPQDRNALAVNDRSIQALKAAMFKEMADQGSARWVDDLDQIVENHNETPHGGIQDAAPNDVEDDPVLQFRLLEDNAQKIKLNERVHEKRVQKMMEAGAFREPLPKSTFQRGFKPRYKNEVEKLLGIDGPEVVSTSGKRILLKRALPVGSESKDTEAPAILQGGSASRDRRAQEALQPFADLLARYLEDRTETLTKASLFLRAQPGFTDAMRSVRAPSLAWFLRLADFDVTTTALGGRSTVRNSSLTRQLREQGARDDAGAEWQPRRPLRWASGALSLTSQLADARPRAPDGFGSNYEETLKELLDLRLSA